MNPETVRQLVWFAKILQMISAAILTPEIIGPDRFERLERLIEKQDYRRSTTTISIMLYIGTIVLLVPWIIIRAYTTISLTSDIELDRSFLAANKDLILGFFWIAVFLKVLTWVIAAKFDALVRLLQSLLSKFATYLRRASLFRTVSVALAVIFFFLGSLLEIVLEFPF